MSENVLQKKILLLASSLGHRLFRVNTGMGWVGKPIQFMREQKVVVFPGDVLIRQGRPLHAGLTEGGSDLIGWTKDGRFLAAETKTIDAKTHPDRLEKQLNFIRQINNSGGKAGICRTVEDFEKIIS